MRYIEPSAILNRRFTDRTRPKWDAAILCFRDFAGTSVLLRALGAKPVGFKVLWGGEEFDGCPIANQIELGPTRVGVIGRCMWGGPQAAIFVEELASLGVRSIIGVGAAGSIVPRLRRGCQVIASSSFTTDGTSKAYTDQAEVGGDSALIAVARAAATNLSLDAPLVRAATVDAIYRETHALVAQHAERGAEVLNMEIAPFFAASRACGIQALWLGHVSDCLVDRTWEPWIDLDAMTATTARLALAVLAGLAAASTATPS